MIENNKALRKQAVKKILSTSAIYLPSAEPQWTSDTRVNYMSQNDFVSFDTQQDQLHLIQRIDGGDIKQIKHVLFISLIGQHPVRIVYTYYDSKQKVFKFAIVPSYSFVEDFDKKEIKFDKNSSFYEIQGTIQQIGEFTVIPDMHSILIPLIMSNNKSYILMQKLNNDSKKLLMINDEQGIGEQHRIIKILQTKLSNLLIILTAKRLYIVKLITTLSCLQQINSIQVNAEEVQNRDVFALFLAQTYVVFRSGNTIYPFMIEEQKIHPLSTINQHNMTGIAGGGNKILYWLHENPTIYQYRIDDKKNCLEFINTINLQNDRVSKVINVTLSQTARNALIVANICLNQQTPQFITEPAVQFILFKLELYTELKIPQNSIYMQNLRYISRNRKVNKLCVPKINEKLYALTGSQVHTLDTHRMMGVMSFDVHPYGFYLIISYLFNIKIYSLQPISMTLLYSFSMHNVKRVEYSPDGSTIVLFSSRKLKLVDAYSFDLKIEFIQKNCNIVDICFGERKKNYYVLLQNGTIYSRSFLDSQIYEVFHIFGQAHQKLILFRIDEINQVLYFLLDNGTVISKKIKDMTANQELYQYNDGQKITDFLIQPVNNLLIFGCKTGKVRIHYNDPFEGRINFKRYYEKFINKSEVTALASSITQNIIYVGTHNGDITILKYKPQSLATFMKKQINKQYDSFSTQETTGIKNNKMVQYFSFDFDLVSMAKLHGDSQQNNLQDKLEGLIDKIQQYGNQYKLDSLKDFIETEENLSNKRKNNDNIIVYRQRQTKINKLKNQKKLFYEKYLKLKKKLTENWEKQIREIYKIQNQLIKEKDRLTIALLNEKNSLEEKTKYQVSSMITELQVEKENMENILKKEKFEHSMQGDFDQFLISESDALKFYSQNLKVEYQKLKEKQRELNKNNGYLETAVKNMLSRKAQEEALLHKIHQQLNLLGEVKEEQQNRIKYLSLNLKNTQETIHKIQNKVKNTPNNVISSDKADSDLCSYKIWMKGKTGQQVEELSNYLAKINDIFQKKSQQMVLTTAQKNKNIQKIEILTKKKAVVKQKLKKVKDKLVTSHFRQEILLKNISTTLIEQTRKQIGSCQFQQKKADKIASFQRILDKVVDFESKNIKNYKRKVKNLGNNNGELLGEYQNLKYFHKSLVDKQNKCIRNINFVKNQLQLEKKKQNREIASQRTSYHVREETPFQKYVKHKKMKSQKNTSSLLQTAVSTPRNLFTPRYTRLSANRKF